MCVLYCFFYVGKYNQRMVIEVNGIVQNDYNYTTTYIYHFKRTVTLLHFYILDDKRAYIEYTP